MATDNAAYKSMLMQNHRLRVQLYLERKGISTINPPHKALAYIADAFKLGFLPDKVAEHLEVWLPIWEKENVRATAKDCALQSHQRKMH